MSWPDMTENQETMSPEETRRMLYELRVHQTALTKVNHLVQQYRLAETLSLLNKEFNNVTRERETRDDD
jgi:hypothetical protein